MEKKIIKSYKFRIYPNKTQTAKLCETLDLCRELYNAALQERRDAWRLERKSISFFEQKKQLPEIKTIRKDLSNVYSQILCDVLNRLDKTFNSFFTRLKKKEKVGFPRFKNQRQFDSFCYPQSGFSLNDNKLALSKIGKIKIKLSRPIQGKVKTCTIKREVDKWFVVFSVETCIEPLPKTNQSVGLDMGISAFATLSDGTRINNSKFYESSQKKLRIAQRRVSRRKKGSNRRKKAIKLLQKIHLKIKNQRNDFQHKISTQLVKEFDLIIIEKLNIKGMSKGILSKQIHDAAWSFFFGMLRYKAENADKQLIEVNPSGTSQRCSECGEIVKKSLSVREHRCHNCNLKIDRDHNAAINILRLGLSLKDATYSIG